MGNKPGRNKPCPCGSGFKYKKCHGPLEKKEKGLCRNPPKQKCRERKAQRQAVEKVLNSTLGGLGLGISLEVSDPTEEVWTPARKKDADQDDDDGDRTWPHITPPAETA